MTSLDKLSLLGIRAYSPDHEQVIQFFHPLTIVVGSNGSGKTTIIEALRVISTGTMPANSENGKSFIHDPKLAGRPIIKSKLKLSFTSTNGSKVVISKNFQVTQKANKKEFKQLDGAIKSWDNVGNEVILSHKCADMEKLIPQLMGVSQPILDYVIFCHQEESLWPMSDSRSLKEKFDEIFSASRYSEALVKIKKVKTDKVKELNAASTDLKILQNTLDLYKKLTNDISNIEETISSKQVEVNNIEENLETLTNEISAYEVVMKEKFSIQSEIAKLEPKLAVLLAEKENAKQRIEECMFSESDEELIQLQAEYNQYIKNFDGSIAESERKLNAHKKRSMEISKEIADVNRLIGGLDVEEQKRKNICLEIEKKLIVYNLLGKDGFTLNTLKEFESKLSNFVSEKKRDLELKKKEIQTIESSFEKQINELKMKEGEIKGKIALKQSNIESVTKKVAEIETMMKNRPSKDVDFKRQLQLAQNELKREEEDFEANKNSNSGKIEFLETTFRENSIQLNNIQNSLMKIQSETQILVQLKMKEQKLLSLEESLTAISSDIAPIILKLAPHISDEEFDYLEVKGLFVKKLDKLNTDCQDISNKIKREESDFATKKGRYDVQLKHNSTLHSKFVTLLSGFSSDVNLYSTVFQDKIDRINFIKDENNDILVRVDVFSKMIDKMWKQVDREKQTSSESRAIILAEIMEQIKDASHSSKACKICNRAVTESDLKVIDQTTNQISLSSSAEEDKVALTKKIHCLESIKNNMANWNELKTIADNISEDDIALKKLKEEIKATEESFQKKKLALNELDNEFKLFANNNKKMEDFGKLRTEIDELKPVIESEQKKLSKDSMNVGTLNSNSKKLKSENDKINLDLEELRSALKEAEELVKSKQIKVNELTTKFVESQNKQMEFERAADDIAKYKETLETNKSELQGLTSELASKAELTKKTETNRGSKRLASKEEEDRIRSLCDESLKEESEFLNLFSEWKTYSKKANDRVDILGKMNTLTKEQSDNATAASEIENSISNLKSTSSSNNNYLLQISDNMDYRKRLHDIKVLSEQVKLLQSKLGKFGADNQNMNSKIENKRTLVSKRDMLLGMIASSDNQLKEVKRNSKEAKFKDIDATYRKKIIEHESLLMATRDLESFYKALDKSLMEFHSLKMQEINSLLRDFWRLTYKGTDIDEILIKSDLNEDSVDTSSVRKQYNYRVVMKQGDSELDMRGRCSAGQKVLASLLIRLALSETFCVNCGILALDEPTTNLDEKNSQALAQALYQLINKRKHQENFQLIVITHDEMFVDLLGRNEVADHYYRVTKNQDGHSVIFQQPISYN